MDRSRAQRAGLFLVLSVVACAICFWSMDERTWSLVKNTGRLAFGTIAIAVPIGVFLAVVIHRTDARFRRAAFSFLVAMLFVPLYLQAAGWDAWFGRQGWLSTSTGSETGRFVSAMLIHAAAAIPWVTLIVGTGLLQVPAELEEAAALEMSGPAVLFRVTLPLSAPAILLASWWVGILTASDITVTDLFQVRTYAEEVYTIIPLMDDQSGSDPASATLPNGTPAVLAFVFISLLAIGLFAHYDFPVRARVAKPVVLGAWRGAVGIALFATVGLIFGVPILNLLRDVAFVLPGPDESPGRWSAAKGFQTLVETPWRFYEEFGWTALITSLAATLATAIAAPLVWGARRGSTWALPATLAVSLSAAIPGPVVALMIIRLLNREQSDVLLWLYDRTVFAPVLAAAVRALPVTTLVSWWGFRTMPRELLDLAKMDGIGVIGRFSKVVWPLRKELFLAAWCAGAAVAAGDLSASLLVTPPGVSTLSIRIFGLLHAGVDDQVAAICLVNAGACIVLAMLTHRLLRRSWTRDV